MIKNSLSLHDQLGNILGPTMRKLNDLKLQLVGRKTNILRIKQVPKDINNDGFGDLLGDNNLTFQSEVISNLYIEYPFNEVEMMQMLDSTIGPSEITAMAITELLPIKMVVPFYGKTSETGRDFDQNDLIVDILVDQYNHKIPIVLSGPKLVGTIWNKQLVKKTYMLTFYRGKLETEIQSAIDSYVNSVDSIIGEDEFYDQQQIQDLDKVNYTNRVIISQNNFDIIDSVSLENVNISRWSLLIKCDTSSVFKKYIVVQNGIVSSLLEICSIGDTINFSINTLMDSDNVYLQIVNNESYSLEISFLRDCFQSNFSSFNSNFQIQQEILSGETKEIDTFSTGLAKIGKWCINVICGNKSFIEDILFLEKNNTVSSSNIFSLGDSISFTYSIIETSGNIIFSVTNNEVSSLIFNCNRLVSNDLNNFDAETISSGNTSILDTIDLFKSHLCKWEIYLTTTTKSNYQQIIALEKNSIIQTDVLEQIGDSILVDYDVITNGNQILLQITNNESENVSVKFIRNLI